MPPTRLVTVSQKTYSAIIESEAKSPLSIGVKINPDLIGLSCLVHDDEFGNNV